MQLPLRPAYPHPTACADFRAKACDRNRGLVAIAVPIAIGTFAPAIPGAPSLPLVAGGSAELTVVFDPTDPECVQDRTTPSQRDFQLRLRATNTGTVGLVNVPG
jgi:hypothetical protein